VFLELLKNTGFWWEKPRGVPEIKLAHLLPSSRFINNKRMEKVMNHYVYYSYEDWGRGYIGIRQCECNICEDDYFGSYYDKTFNPTNKIILMECNTREEALAAEVILHNFYDVKNNPHFVNQANQTSSKFDYDNTGMPMSEETRKKISEAKKGHLKDKKQSPEQIAKRMESRRNGGGWNKETGKKISQSLKGNIPWNKTSVLVYKTMYALATMSNHNHFQIFLTFFNFILVTKVISTISNLLQTLIMIISVHFFLCRKTMLLCVVKSKINLKCFTKRLSILQNLRFAICESCSHLLELL